MRGTNGEKVIRLIRVFKTKCMSEGIKVSVVIAAKLIVGTHTTDGGEWACDESEMEERWLQKYLIPMSVIIAGESWDCCAEPKDMYV